MEEHNHREEKNIWRYLFFGLIGLLIVGYLIFNSVQDYNNKLINQGKKESEETCKQQFDTLLQTWSQQYQNQGYIVIQNTKWVPQQ